MHKGINTTADEGQTPIVTQGGAFSRAAFGGNNRSGSIDVAASLLSHSGPHGRQDFTSETFLVEGHPDPAYAISAGQQGKGGVFGSGRDSQDTFVTCFHPTQDPISSTDGSAHAMGTGSKGGCSSHAVCVTGHRTHALTTRAAACEEDGTGRGTPITPAIAFSAKDSGGDATNEVSPTMRAMHHIDGNANAGGQLAVAFTKAKRAQSSSDDESWVPGEVAPTQNQFDQGDTRATTVVAFAQNQLGEVRVNPDVMGTVNQNQNASGRNTPMVCGFSPLQGGRSMPVTPESPTLEAGTGNKTPAVAFATRTRDGIKVPEVMKDGVVPALTNPGQGGRADAVNIASAMQVRRLCPSECEALQGFPIGYTDVTYRKKPAADGPRYRALGNSMAVPCMWWLGKRIHEATQCD